MVLAKYLPVEARCLLHKKELNHVQDQCDHGLL